MGNKISGLEAEGNAEFKSEAKIGANMPFGRCCCLVAQSHPALWDPVDPPGSSVHEISQAKILEWVAISLSKGSFRPIPDLFYPYQAEVPEELP